MGYNKLQIQQRLHFCRDLTGSVEDATEVALSNLILVKRRTFHAFKIWIKFGTREMQCLHRALLGRKCILLRTQSVRGAFGKMGEDREGHISLINLPYWILSEKLFYECEGSFKEDGTFNFYEQESSQRGMSYHAYSLVKRRNLSHRPPQLIKKMLSESDCRLPFSYCCIQLFLFIINFTIVSRSLFSLTEAESFILHIVTAQKFYNWRK